MLDDYLSSASVGDAIVAVNDIIAQLAVLLVEDFGGGSDATSAIVAEVIKQTVSVCLDRCERDQEMLATLLSQLELFGTFNSADVCLGLTAVLQRLEDMIVDVPKADYVVANLICQLVIDGTVRGSLRPPPPQYCSATHRRNITRNSAHAHTCSLVTIARCDVTACMAALAAGTRGFPSQHWRRRVIVCSVPRNGCQSCGDNP